MTTYTNKYIPDASIHVTLDFLGTRCVWLTSKKIKMYAGPALDVHFQKMSVIVCEGKVFLTNNKLYLGFSRYCCKVVVGLVFTCIYCFCDHIQPSVL